MTARGDAGGLRSQSVTSNLAMAPVDAVVLPPLHRVRGQDVILDADLAAVFGVATKALNQQVKRNENRFTEEFAFRLTPGEAADLRSRDVTSKEGRGGARYAPNAFTEYGVVMAATVLNAPRAVAAAQHIVRSFVDMRRAAHTHAARDAVAGANVRQKLHDAMGRVLDAIAIPEHRAEARATAESVAREAVGALRARLAKGGIQNEKMEAEIAKLIAETEKIYTDVDNRRLENRGRELALVAKQLKLAIEAQQMLDGGDVSRFLAVLDEMDRD